jgi:predicted ATPase/DNA-binding winged helix-turn-helix (wHTH) protein
VSATEQDLVVFADISFAPVEGWIERAGTRLELPLRSRALLVALVNNAGKTIPKRELIAATWPDGPVDEVTLRGHIAALRKILGERAGQNRFIANIMGQGYRFVPDVKRRRSPDRAIDDGVIAPRPVGTAKRLLGRKREIERTIALLKSHRFATIIGPGGIGKTSLALLVADQLVGEFGEDIAFVSLSGLNEPNLVLSAVSLPFSVKSDLADPPRPLIDKLRPLRGLLILDSCEHLIDEVATLAERIIRETPAMHIIATSREPLTVEGEQIHRLFPLEVPPSPMTSAADARGFSAIELFLDRFEVAGRRPRDDDEIPLIVEICRRLDGIPLAVELAAARARTAGVKMVADGLNDIFSLLADSETTALPRHRTLRATLDWSFHLLSEIERLALRRLSVFRGAFSLDMAAAVAGFARLDATTARGAIRSLASKSLLALDQRGGLVFYKFLDTTRTYAAEKLEASGETMQMMRRHADACAALFQGAETDWERLSKEDWYGKYSVVDDIREAVNWCFSSEGDVGTGATILTMSAPLWFALSLMEEYCERAERALAAIAGTALAGSTLEVKLRLALGVATFNARGCRAELNTLALGALHIAEHCDALELRLRSLWQLARERSIHGDYDGALDYCLRFDRLVEQSRDSRMYAVRDRMMSLGLFFVGRHEEARVYGERAVAHPEGFVRTIHMSFNEYDHKVASRTHLARIAWAVGDAESAAKYADRAVSEGLTTRYAPAACYALTFAAVPVALWSREASAAAHYLELLEQACEALPHGFWREWLVVLRYASAAMWAESEADRTAIADRIFQTATVELVLDTVATFHEDLISPEALARALSSRPGWNAAEAMRGHARRMLRQGEAEQAVALLKRSRSVAATQGAAGWEWRSSIELARSYAELGRKDLGSALLASVRDCAPVLTTAWDQSQYRRAIASCS